MERVRNAFLTLLQSGLWGRDPVTEDFAGLSDEEWDEIFRMSGRQTVTGIVFDGICRLPEESQPSERQFAGWVVAVDMIETGNRRMNAALKELAALFAGNGLWPVLLKGQGIAALYPTPAHRECGDIDFYFSSHRPLSLPKRPSSEVTNDCPFDRLRDRAEEIIESKGIKVSRMPDGSLSYSWKGIEIEHHPSVVDLNSPRLKNWVKTLDNDPGFVPSSLAGGLWEPSPELNALLLNTHILKHAIGKGIGLRQMCDLAMAYHRMSEEEKSAERGERIFSLYRQAGILKWSRLLHSFLVGVIGLPEEELPYSERDVDYAPLMTVVEEGGNFGQYRSGGYEGSGVRPFDGLRDRKGAGTRPFDGLRDRGGAIRRKLATAGMFFRRAGFSLRYAPGEAFWMFTELVKGQFRK